MFATSRSVSSSQLLLCFPFTHSAQVLSEGFQEGTATDFKAGFPVQEDPYRDDYEYLSDSDLDSVDDMEIPEDSLFAEGIPSANESSVDVHAPSPDQKIETASVYEPLVSFHQRR